MKMAEDNGAIYILANDPDADRLAVAELIDGRNWRIYNGNEIGAMLGWWQLQVHRSTTKDKDVNLFFVSSTVSSKMLGSIAKKEGLTFEVKLDI